MFKIIPHNKHIGNTVGIHNCYGRLDPCTEFTTSLPSNDSVDEISSTLSVLNIFGIASVVGDVELSLALRFPGVGKYSLMGLISAMSLRDWLLDLV